MTESIKENQSCICSQANSRCSGFVHCTTIKEAKATLHPVATVKEAKTYCLEFMVHLRGQEDCLLYVPYKRMSRPGRPPMAIRVTKAHKAKGTWQHLAGPGDASHPGSRVRSQADFLSASQATLCMLAQWSSRMHSGGFLSPFIGADASISTCLSYCKGLLQWRNSPASVALLLHQCPNAVSSGPKDQHPPPDPVESMTIGWNHIERQLWKGPPAPRGERSCPGTECSQAKPCAEACSARTLTW